MPLKFSRPFSQMVSSLLLSCAFLYKIISDHLGTTLLETVFLSSVQVPEITINYPWRMLPTSKSCLMILIFIHHQPFRSQVPNICDNSFTLSILAPCNPWRIIDQLFEIWIALPHWWSSWRNDAFENYFPKALAEWSVVVEVSIVYMGSGFIWLSY